MTPAELALRADHLEVQHLLAYAQGCGGEVLTSGAVRAVYCGPDLPVNVAAGLGTDTSAASALPEVEAFFEARVVAPAVVTYGHVHPDLLTTLAHREYRLQRVLNLHATALDRRLPERSPLVRIADPGEWLEVAVAAFGASTREIMTVTSRRPAPATSFWVAKQDGRLAGAGVLSVFDGLALLSTAATLEGARGRGVQAALLNARLHAAREVGCSHALVMTSPGSGSERNVFRAGFAPLAARLTFVRPVGA